jgi:hypothetical protein
VHEVPGVGGILGHFIYHWLAANPYSTFIELYLDHAFICHARILNTTAITLMHIQTFNQLARASGE